MYENLDKIWVEVDMSSSYSRVDHYCGLMAYLDYESIIKGNLEKPFVLLEQTFWYDWPEDNDTWAGKKLITYGKGDYSEYQGEIAISTKLIIVIHRLNHGPKDLLRNH